jgi:uncharacterized protein (TIGR02246 family)
MALASLPIENGRVMAADRSAEMKKAHAAISATLARFAAADTAGDAAAVAGCFDGDASLLPPSGPPLRGRDDIKVRYLALHMNAGRTVTIKADETWVMDDWAMSRGTISGESRSKSGGPPRPIRDTYLMMLKRRGDRWEIFSYAWSAK